MDFLFMAAYMLFLFFFFSSRRRHTRLQGDWSSDVCSSDLGFMHLVELELPGLEWFWFDGPRGRRTEPGIICRIDRSWLRSETAGDGSVMVQIGRASCRERV